MSQDFPNKDSYDKQLGFSRITRENWNLPDRKNYIPFGITETEWIEPFLAPKLDATVPENVVRLFEIARGCMIYSWFFYPLGTLGFEQSTRVSDLAVRERCRLLQKESDNFSVNLKTLVAAGVIAPGDEAHWQGTRGLRNLRSHPQSVMLMDPNRGLRLQSNCPRAFHLPMPHVMQVVAALRAWWRLPCFDLPTKWRAASRCWLQRRGGVILVLPVSAHVVQN